MTRSANAASTGSYPKAFEPYQEQEVLVLEPLDGVLKKGRRHFHLTAPNALQVSIFSEGVETPLHKNGDDFEGDCTVEPGTAMVLMTPKESGLLNLIAPSQLPLLWYDSH